MNTKVNIPPKLNLHTKIFLIIFLFTIFSGAIRKWVVNTKEIANFFLLLQILVPYSFILIRNGLKNWKKGIGLLGFVGIVFALCTLNPLNLTVYHGILGLLLHSSFFFILLFYLNNRSKFQFEKIIDLLIYISFFQILLGFYQYSQPSDSFINTYADVEAVGGIAGVGNSVRITGTFSYISGFTGFLFFYGFLIWVMFKVQYSSYKTLILLSAGMVACFMSGARSATYLYVIILFITLYSEFTQVTKTFFDFKLFIPILIVSTIYFSFDNQAFLNLIQDSFIGFSERRARGIEVGEENFRIIGDFVQVFNFSGKYPVFGIGFGSTYQGANILFGTSPLIIEYGFFESELVRIILEGGYLLLLTRTLLTIYLINQLMMPPISKILITIILLFFIPIIFNVYNSVFAALGLIVIDYFYYKEYHVKYMLQKQINLSKVIYS